ncbi:MAG TPA: sulfatase-like hydrolase/transferase, partial [Thermoanaerobaculia bacterium]|nr:sulfatase-like hydrolase/transferase [Thermoanaerobaculia bacterium]
DGRRMKSAVRIAAPALLLALCLLPGCRRGREPVFPSAPVVLISVDTLRADHLPAYGYTGVATPHIDALRRDSILFANAYSHVPLTLPSHVSLFTGLLPPQNGVRDNIGYSLEPRIETLASCLKKAGYATGGAVSSIILARATGVSRGFDFYEDDVEPTAPNQSLGHVQRDGGRTLDRLRGWIERTPGKLFAFLHLFEPHTPYDPPEPYKSRYPVAYDGEIARADEIVGDFLQLLKTRGLYENAVIVFLSDHGEGLNDHGEEEHGVLLYREAIRVPLFVKLPRSRRAGETVTAPAGLIDVFPTVVAALGLKPPAGLAGIPLLAGGEAAGSRRVYSETLYPRLHLGWSDLASLEDERYQYIEAPRPELYDIVADPHEKKDLAAGLPPAFRSMRLELSRLPHALQAPGVSDPERVKKLAALGYISATSSDLSTANLPDPKDRVQAVEKLKTGFGHLQAGRYGEALPLFRELLAENPRMTDVWGMLAQTEVKLGNEREALQALQQTARLSPGPQALMALAEFYLETGQYDLARKHALLAGEGGGANVHEDLARIAVAAGDWETAESEAAAALKEYPDRRNPRLVLARIKKERGDLAGALAELEVTRSLTEKGKQPPLSNLSYLRGDILARLGRSAEAEAAFREEIRDFPTSSLARAGLAMLYASQGKADQAFQTLEALARLKTPDALFAAARTYEILGDRDSAARLRREIRRSFPAARERPRASG